MTEQKKAIEQLWYTWSDVGLEKIRAGFQIRAASEGLRDLISERVKNLDRYQRYFLPRNVNPAIIDPDDAPVCLSFTDTASGTERKPILVHKKYTGRDAVGRYGAFFIHLLDNLPEGFCARDAILLWKSSFWKTSDASLKNRFSDSLDTIPFTTWKEHLQVLRKESEKKAKAVDLVPQHARRLEQYLSYLILVYLIKKPYIDSAIGLAMPEKIYIAAPDNDVALLISGLTHCLPQQLVKNLTFSTYESDVTEAGTEIVGTCWLSGAEQDPEVVSLLPEHYYSEKLAINCYTGQHTQLENHHLVQNRRLAAQYAQDAAAYFLYGDSDFYDLLKSASDSPDIDDVDKLLQRYEIDIILAEDPTPKAVEFVLSSSDYPYAAKMLSKRGYQEKVIDLALKEPGWWDTFARARIDNLRRQSEKVPRLAQALSGIAARAIPYAENIVKAGVALAKVPTSQEMALNNKETLRIIMELMQCTASPAAVDPTADENVWRALLEKLREIVGVFVFFNRYWDFYAELMHIWSRTLSLPRYRADNKQAEKDYKLLQPLFSPLSWDRFGDFLALNLPLAWNERVTAAFVSKSPAVLNRDILYHLEQNYHSLIETLLRQLSQDARSSSQDDTKPQLLKNAQPWITAGELFRILANSHYGQKLSLLFLLLDSSMGHHKGNAELLLRTAQLSVQETISFLNGYGPRYLPSADRLSAIVLQMFEELVKSGNPTARVGKLDVLLNWLASPLLSQWLDLSPIGEEHLTMLLTAAHMDVQESEEFFRHYGQKYIGLYPWSATLINLFDKYARTPGDLRMHLLFIWLNLPLQQTTFEQVLWAAHLQEKERIRFIEQYGELHLLNYPESQILLNYVLEYLKYVQAADIDIFLNKFSPEMPSAPERFLWFLLNSTLLNPASNSMVRDWYLIGIFVRKPALLNPEIAASIARMLTTADTPTQKRNKLIKKVAIACVENGQALIHGMPVLYQMLTPLNPAFWHMLQEIAESARDGIRERRYTRTLYVSIIHFALTFKTVFPPEAAQEDFVQDFLEALLQGISKKTFKWLDSEIKKEPTKLAAGWQHYRTQLYLSAVVTPPSLFERVWLWWERLVALTQMRRALRSKQLQRIVDTSIDYMTTLSSYDDDVVPQQWQQQINEAVNTLNIREEASWQQYEEGERHQIQVISASTQQATSTHMNAAQSSHSQRSKLRQIRAVAFKEMKRALRRRRIGRIVRVYTNHMMTLETYTKEVPNEWWRQIETATSFYLACEEASESTDEAREQAILSAANAITDLVRDRITAPGLTVHEKRRIESARHYVEAQQAQRVRAASREQMLSAQVFSDASGTRAVMELPSKGTPETGKQGLFGRFR